VLLKTDAERAKTAEIARWGGEGLSWEVGAESEKAIGIAVVLSGLAGTMAANSESQMQNSREGRTETC
jgi:hypothetical protein